MRSLSTVLFLSSLIISQVTLAEGEAQGDCYGWSPAPKSFKGNTSAFIEIPMPWHQLDGVWQIQSPIGVLQLKIKIENANQQLGAKLDLWLREALQDRLIDSAVVLPKDNNDALNSLFLWDGALHRMEIHAYKAAYCPNNSDVTLQVKMVRIGNAINFPAGDEVILDQPANRIANTSTP